MRKVLGTKLALAGAVGLVAALAAGSAAAAPCSACHTMHNSQDGAPMRGAGLTEPLPKLLLNDCIGCHTGVNTTTSLTTAQPEVYSTGAPTYGTNTLAGGNFYWSTQAGTENTGHNVAELGVADPDLGNTPPGHTGALAQQLTCAGVYGCHGERTAGNEVPLESLHGSHHYPHNTTADALAHTTVGNSFRYLFGVDGREDTDWEFTNADDNANHNIYKGVDRTNSLETVAADATSINALCGQCHGAFHRQGNDTWGIVENGADAGTIGVGQWIRHPTDYDMPGTASGTEYAAYAAYRVETPVGTANLAATIDVTAADSRIVLCVSCHRAHGSPYADILRWDYSLMETGNGGAAAGTGCFACHTLKD